MPRNSTPPEVRVMEFFETADPKAASMILGLAGQTVRRRLQESVPPWVTGSTGGGGGGRATAGKGTKKRVVKKTVTAPTADDAPPFD